MYIKTNKLKKKIFLVIVILLITLTILNLCIQLTSKNDKNKSNIAEKTIIAGKDISNKKITQTIDQFDWEQDVNPIIGSISIEDNGKTIHMTGNEILEGKNAIYIIPESHQEQIFSFDYNVEYGDSFNAVEYGDSFNAAGVLLRVKKDGDTLKGYMISFNNPNVSDRSWYNLSFFKLGAIWKFSYTLGQNMDNIIDRTLVKGLDLPQSGSMTVTSNSNQIVITGTNINETINISDGDDVGEGFGFFTNHYAHGCSEIGEFNLTNFAVTVIDIEPHNLYIDPNGGTWNESSEVSTIVGEYKDEVNITVPTRPGYNFAGWTFCRLDANRK